MSAVSEILTLDELAALEKAATPGPWRLRSPSGQCYLQHEHGKGSCDYRVTKLPECWDGCVSVYADEGAPMSDALDVITTTEEYGEMREDDAALIVAARNALPELLRIARAVADNGEYDSDGYCRMGCDHVMASVTVYAKHADDCAYVAARKLAGGAL